jgi:hypothetical protein
MTINGVSIKPAPFWAVLDANEKSTLYRDVIRRKVVDHNIDWTHMVDRRSLNLSVFPNQE